MIFIPLILFANCKSLLINVTLLQWIAQKFASYKTDIIYAYDAYWRAAKADIWRRNYLILYNIYLTSLEKLNFLMSICVPFWYFLIYRSATVPGLNLIFFFTLISIDAFFFNLWFCGSCFLGTFWATDFLDVCFVRAILNLNFYKIVWIS